MDHFSFTDNAAFWLLWLVTAVVCTAAAVDAIRRPDRILGFVPVFCLAFGYFYVFQAAVVAVSLADRLQPWMFATGQGVALACLVATLLGHRFGSRPANLPPTTPPYSYRPRSVWYAGVFLMLAGLAGMYSFVAAWIGGQADWSVTAYWYAMFHVFYPGMAMCVRQYSGSREYHTPSALLVLFALSVVFLYPFVINARRGPIFPFFVVVAYTYYLTTRRVNRAILVSGLVCVGLLMLLFVMVRDYQHEGGTWGAERMKQVDIESLLLRKAEVESDNEFLYHCGFVASALELDRFQYGTGYLNLSIHWIPRQWWPDKPTLLDQGWFPRVGNYEMLGVLGWQMTPGAAYGGVAEAFQQFSWLMPLFWFGLGWVVGRAYALAYYRPTVPRQTLYVGMISVTHWLVSQGFIAAFVPVMAYTLVPLALMYCFREHKPLARRPAPGASTPSLSSPARPLRQSV